MCHYQLFFNENLLKTSEEAKFTHNATLHSNEYLVASLNSRSYYTKRVIQAEMEFITETTQSTIPDIEKKSKPPSWRVNFENWSLE